MKLSVIVSIYNMDKFLINSINSIINGIHTNDYECILVEGSSTDNSGKYCYEFQKRNKNITYIHKNTTDLNELRNTGLSIATGEYIYFIDGCNLLNESFLTDAIKYLDNNKFIDIYIRNYKVYNNNKITNFNSYFIDTKLGPAISMCVFRRSAINIKFDNPICSEIIFTGKVLQASNDFYYDKNNYDSYIQVTEYKYPESIDYAKEFNIDWVRYVKDEIKTYTSKKFDLSYHVIDRCNKNCIACGHFSPLADKNDNGVTVEQFTKDVESAAFLSPNVRHFILTGGEPTLNKNLIEIIKISKKYFKNVHLCSNGLNRQFFIDNAKFLNDNNISVFITKYNLDNFDDIKNVLNYVYFYSIPYLEDENGKRVMFNYKHLSSEKVNIDRKYYCERGNCTQLKNKKLYLCQYTANFEVFKKYFKDIEFPFGDDDTYIDLSLNKNINDVLDFVFYHYPKICEHCRQPLYDKNIDLITIELKQSKNELTEWYQ